MQIAKLFFFSAALGVALVYCVIADRNYTRCLRQEKILTLSDFVCSAEAINPVVTYLG